MIKNGKKKCAKYSGWKTWDVCKMGEGLVGG